MRRDSLYLAMVLLATTNPFEASRSTIWVSDRGFSLLSSLTACLIRVLIAVYETEPPVSVDI